MVACPRKSTGHLRMQAKKVFPAMRFENSPRPPRLRWKGGSDGGGIRLDRAAPSQSAPSIKARPNQDGCRWKVVVTVPRSGQHICGLDPLALSVGVGARQIRANDLIVTKPLVWAGMGCPWHCAGKGHLGPIQSLILTLICLPGILRN